MYYNLTVFAVFAFLYSAIAGGVSRTVISGPMLFTAFGLIFGPVGLGIFSPDINNQTLRTLADLTLALKLVFKEIGIGIAVGLVLTFLGGWVLKKCWQHGWITEVWMQVTVVVLAMACFAAAQSAHGSGYIAAFIGGLLFGSMVKKSKHELLLAAEGTGEAFALITLMVFGSAVIGQALGNFSWAVIIYALLSLTVIRMLSIFLSLTGTGERTESKLFLTWFGPRGLASVVFAIIVLNSGVPAAGTLVMTVVCTVTMSIFAHGLTANPLASALGARIERLKR